MPERNKFSVYWSEQSLNNAIRIESYLRENFTVKEIIRFHIKLQTFEEAVSNYPKLYPEANVHSSLRRAVLSKQLSVYYKITDDRIEVVAILDNRCDISKWI